MLLAVLEQSDRDRVDGHRTALPQVPRLNRGNGAFTACNGPHSPPQPGRVHSQTAPRPARIAGGSDGLLAPASRSQRDRGRRRHVVALHPADHPRRRRSSSSLLLVFLGRYPERRAASADDRAGSPGSASCAGSSRTSRTKAIERQNPELAGAIKKMNTVASNPNPQAVQKAMSRLTPAERRAYMEAAQEQGGVPDSANRQMRRQAERMQQQARGGRPAAARPRRASASAPEARRGSASGDVLGQILDLNALLLRRELDHVADRDDADDLAVLRDR